MILKIMSKRDQWISVSERLPEPNKTVLGITENNKVVFCYWYLTNENEMATMNSGVKYWMPIPEPPRKKTWE